MKNFIFISPNFPENYYKFCRELKNDGFRVLGIGDCEYSRLSRELKESLSEYYKVSSLENYDEVYRAVAFFIYKYGKIDFLESNNEYWLERDAALRTAFNIDSGFKSGDMRNVKFKSAMKENYLKAGVKVARYHMVDDFDGCKKFIDEVGYPVIVKPDNGVGANATYKLSDDEALEKFLYTSPKNYIMEEFIDGIVRSYDAIVDGNGEPVFETGLVETGDLMEIVNSNANSCYYYSGNIEDDVREIGRKVLKAFGVKNRFIHFEFFRLSRDQHIGKKGEVVALEVNMRPAGGISPDLMNYANSTDVYKIWADVLAFGKSSKPVGEKFFCGYAGRRDGKPFYYTDKDVIAKYGDKLKSSGRVPDALAGCLGNYCYIANFKTKEEMEEFFAYVTETI